MCIKGYIVLSPKHTFTMSIVKNFSLTSLLFALSMGATHAQDTTLTVDASNSPFDPNLGGFTVLGISNENWGYNGYYSKVIVDSGGSMFVSKDTDIEIITTELFKEPTGTITSSTDGLRLMVNQNGSFTADGRITFQGGVVSVAGNFTSTDTISMGSSDQNLYFKVEKTGVVDTNSLSIVTSGKDFSRVQVEGKVKTNTLDVTTTSGKVALEVTNGGSLDVATTMTHTYGILKIGSDTSNVNVTVGALTSLVATPTGTNPDLYTDYIDIAKGSTLTIKGTEVSSMKGVQLAGTLNIESGIAEIGGNAGLSFQGGTLNIKSGATLRAGEKVSDYLFSLHNGTNKINVYGKGENAGKFSVYDANNKNSKGIRLNDYNSNSAQSILELWAESEGAVQTHVVTFIKNAKLVLKSKNVITATTGKTSVTLGTNTTAEIDVYADNVFSNVAIQAGSLLTLNLMGENAELGFSEFTKGYNYDPLVKLTINEFQNNRLFFTKEITLETLQSMVKSLVINTKYGEETEPYTFDDISFDEYLHDEYGKIWYMNVIGLVPEPAEWAAIFGGIALALAMFRKRSKK